MLSLGIRCQDTACNSDDPQRPTQITMFLRLFPLMMISLPLLTGEACGLVGGAKLASGDIARAVVGLVGPNNKTFCTATVVAHNVVLSAGHCLQAGTSYRVQYKSNGLRQFSDVLDWVMPPQFDPQVLPVVADLALVRYSTPLSPEIGVATLGLNEPPAWPGDQVTVVGGGIAFKGLNETGFNRMATLTVALGAFGDQQIRLVELVRKTNAHWRLRGRLRIARI